MIFYWVPGDMLCAKDKTVNKLGEVPVLMKYVPVWELVKKEIK